MRHLMSPLDFSVDELDKLLDLANDIEKYPNKYAHACEGKKLATCFYEPSTRTRLSFEAAMLNLGGSVLGFASADSSSASKGESVSDTIRVSLFEYRLYVSDVQKRKGSIYKQLYIAEKGRRSKKTFVWQQYSNQYGFITYWI